MSRYEIRLARSPLDIRFPSYTACRDDRGESGKASGCHKARETLSRRACSAGPSAGARGSQAKAAGAGQWETFGSYRCAAAPRARFLKTIARVHENEADSRAFRVPASPPQRAEPARPWNAP